MAFWKSDIDNNKFSTNNIPEIIDSSNNSNNLTNLSVQNKGNSEQNDFPFKGENKFTKIRLLPKKRLQTLPINMLLKSEKVSEQNHIVKTNQLINNTSSIMPIKNNAELLKLPEPTGSHNYLEMNHFLIPPVEESNLFKKREIKCRNIRKSDMIDTIYHISVSPQKVNENNIEEDENNKNYPTSWAEHKDFNLNSELDGVQIKHKSLIQRNSKFEFRKYFSFESPSVPIEMFKIESKKRETCWIPFSYLRCTGVSPSILYSTNRQENSHLTKKQLYAMIPQQRIAIIEELGAPKNQIIYEDSPVTISRKWYSKNWEKTEISPESKVLDHSVGLSFLQSYAEDDEIEDEHPNDHTEKQIENYQIFKASTSTDDKSANNVEIVEEKLTPEGSPDAAAVNINVIKSKWDEPTAYSSDNDDDGDDEDHTPPPIPLDNSDILIEAHENILENIVLEYEKTKGELNQLEEVLKTTNYLKTVKGDHACEKTIAGKKDKKKRSKNLNRSSRKRRHLSSSSETEISDYQRRKSKKKHKKQKKESRYYDRSGRRMNRTNKSKKKIIEDSGDDGDKYDDNSRDSELLKKNKSKQKVEKHRIRHSSEDSSAPNRILKQKILENIIPEDYEDDMKFFAERFDAEKELRGKGGKHKTKTIIALDELSVHLKMNESNNENDESSKIELPINNTETAGEEILKGETPKKEAKVDLLKMNEEYLKEQKKKEVEVIVPSEPLEDNENRDNNVALIEIKPENVETKIISNLENIVKAEPIVEVENPCTDAPIFDDLNTAAVVCVKETVVENPKLENKELSEIEALTLLNIKKEDVNFEVETVKTFVKNNSWESEEDDEEEEVEEESVSSPTEADENDSNNETRQTPPDFNLPLEIIPLNIEPFIKRDLTKVEKSLIATESPQKIIRIVDDPDFFDIETEIPITEIKKNWNQSSLLSIIKQEAPDNDNDDVIDLEEINNSNTSDVLLENEYEEFMKAVSNKDAEEEACINIKNDENNEERENEAEEIEKLVKNEPEDESFKPIAVPSPVKKEPILPALINQSLINLSLSANVTQNFTLSLGSTTHLPTISTPSITSSINISKPNVELISTPGSSDTTTRLTASGSTLMDFSLSDEKPVFETLTLPTKKLLNNSKLLNLDDSDSQDRIFEKETTKKNHQQSSINKKIEEKSEMWPIMDKPSKKSSNRNNERRSSISRNRYNESLPSSNQRRNRRDLSPILVKRRRDSSPVPTHQRRRFSSPQQRRRSPKQRPRSPLRRKRSSSPRNRRLLSPKQRERSFSPRGKRSISPMMMMRRAPLPPSLRSPSSPHQQRQKRFRTSSRRSFSPRDLSPLSLKRNNVPDSTISDEFLQRQQHYNNEPLRAGDGGGFSPKRLPLDVRISQVLGMENSSGQISPRPYCCNEIIQPHPDYLYDELEETNNYEMCSSSSSSINRNPAAAAAAVQSNYRQVGNMLQILPSDDVIGGLPSHHHQIQMHHHHHQLPSSSIHHQYHHQNNYEAHPVPTDLRSKIVQVGNMLQIVPAEMPSNRIMHSSEVKIEPASIPTTTTTTMMVQEKSSSSFSSVAEAAMLQKAIERRAEREQRRQEREKRRKEKEKRRKEKERAKQAKLNVVTENMIKRALELEIEEEDVAAAAAGAIADLQPQWPPAVINSANKDAGKSILITKQSSSEKSIFSSSFDKKSKLVQFADGIRPGEGTSPSAGEELSSPPPPPKKKLPKEKRFKKLNFHKKKNRLTNNKRKVKVKVIKKPPPSSPLLRNNNESNSDEDNLPPPSPPPGSPPPHIFPPRLKVHTVNNVPGPYLASIIQNVPQQTNQSIPFQANLYRPQINMMVPPPPGHIPSVSPLTGGVSSSHLSSGHNNRHF